MEHLKNQKTKGNKEQTALELKRIEKLQAIILKYNYFRQDYLSAFKKWQKLFDFVRDCSFDRFLDKMSEQVS